MKQETKNAGQMAIELLTALSNLRQVILKSDDRKIWDNGENSEVVAVASEILKKYDPNTSPNI